MVGISFMKAVKQNPVYKFTPVLMLITESGEAKKLEGRSAGASAWICKPFSPAQLIDAVQRLCLPSHLRFHPSAIYSKLEFANSKLEFK